ncbi:MAG: glycosyltransferase [Acidimicrobiales bacterium]
MGHRLLLVCSVGGHLTEAMHLVEDLDDIDEIHWATPDTGPSRTLLTGEAVWPITNVGPRELGKTLALFPLARKLIAQLQPTVVISTGASPAIPFLVVAAIRGIPAHFVESLTRIDAPSLTGRLLASVPTIRCYSHYDNFGGRWLRIGSQFDSYEVQTGLGHVPIRRVVVTVGTLRDYPFRSLVERLLEILPQDAEVLWQTGSTHVDDLPIDGRELVPADEMRRAMRDADLIVGHAGCGTTLDALAAGNLPLLVPRRSARGEHADDHQAQLAEHLAARGLAIVAESEELTTEHLQRAADGAATRVDGKVPLALAL